MYSGLGYRSFLINIYSWRIKNANYCINNPDTMTLQRPLCSNAWFSIFRAADRLTHISEYP